MALRDQIRGTNPRWLHHPDSSAAPVAANVPPLTAPQPDARLPRGGGLQRDYWAVPPNPTGEWPGDEGLLRFSRDCPFHRRQDRCERRNRHRGGRAVRSRPPAQGAPRLPAIHPPSSAKVPKAASAPGSRPPYLTAAVSHISRPLPHTPSDDPPH